MDSNEAERIRRLLLEPISEDNDELPEDSDDGDENEDYVSDHNTDTEQSADEEEVPAGTTGTNSNYILGKDNETKWYLCNPPQSVRRPPHNVLRMHLPGVRGPAKNCLQILECWQLFFTNDMLNDIVRYTNIQIDIYRSEFARERDAKETNLTEIKAFLGLLYLAGVLKSSHVNIDDLYTKDFTGVEFFRATMSSNRLKFLLRSIRFDNKNTRNERRRLDKLAPIRDLFEQFNNHCKQHYSIGETGTVDEMLEPFRGRCPFRQFIKSKPAKYGIKVYCLADARTFYACNMEVYCGKQPEGPYQISNTAKDVVLRAIEPISGSGRGVTVDNFFSSIPLANILAIDHRLSVVGTLRKNKREIPNLSVILDHKQRQLFSSLFVYGEQATLLSYKSKPNKVVLLLSTQHRSDDIDPESGDLLKPVMLTHYNNTKGGVDTLDQLKATYTVARKTNRWSLSLFFSIMNTAGVNAYIIYLANTRGKLSRRDFLKTLCKELCMDHLRYRATLDSLPRQLKTKVKELAGIQEDPRPRAQGAAGRCAYCSWRQNRKTKVTCSLCERYICKEHTTNMCNNCSEDRNIEDDEEM